MTASPHALPAVLTTAAAGALGVDRRQLAHLGYAHPTRGAFVAGWADQSDAEVRISLAAQLAPEQVTIGGWAAAWVHETRHRARDDEVVVFDGSTSWLGPRDQKPILLLAPTEARIASRPGLRVFRSEVDAGERERHGDLVVSTPTRTAFDLARLSSPVDAVVALDRLMSLGLVRADEVATMLDERRRWRGVRAARRALHLAESSVRSPMETVMRLEWMAAGLPRPLCNVVVEDRRGRFVAMPDLLDPVSGLVGEYDGGVHAGAERRSADAARREAMLAVGLTPVTMTAADVRGDERRARWRSRLQGQWRSAAARSTRGWRLREVA
jgi:hypothetical protein